MKTVVRANSVAVAEVTAISVAPVNQENHVLTVRSARRVMIRHRNPDQPW